MKKGITGIALVSVSLCSLLLQHYCFAQDRLDVFPGGLSDISSDDPDRAKKAILKWSSANGQQDGVKLSDAPFSWDHRKVGRPVFIRVIKNDNRKGKLELWIQKPRSRQFELLRIYRVHYFSGRLGPKFKEGDMQAPEGFYYVNRSRLNPLSSFHMSMDIGYPNEFDQFHDRTGTFLMIHGSTPSTGCFAMTDCSIEQIYTMVVSAMSKGQRFVRVHCFPFEMTEKNLNRHKDSEHYEFWQNLKRGWDWFEENRRPPNVEVEGGRYLFSGS